MRFQFFAMILAARGSVDKLAPGRNASLESSAPQLIAKLDELIQTAQDIRKYALPLIQQAVPAGAAARHGHNPRHELRAHEHSHFSGQHHEGRAAAHHRDVNSMELSHQFSIPSVNPSKSDKSLPFCVDGEPGHMTLTPQTCDRVQGAARWLCNGAMHLQRATCAQLADHAFMRAAVESVGLTPDARGSALYGNASHHMVEVHGTAARKKVGLWQNPTQLAAALIHIGSHVPVHRYIEVGVYTGKQSRTPSCTHMPCAQCETLAKHYCCACLRAFVVWAVTLQKRYTAFNLLTLACVVACRYTLVAAWTCCFISAYLRRVSPLGDFRGYAVDVTSVAIAVGTKSLLSKLNVSYVKRGYDGKMFGAPPPYDFCFVDGDHAYSGVKRDYEFFSPSCSYM